MIMMSMNRVALYARNFLKNTNPNCSSVKFTAFSQPRFRFYASESDSSKLPNTQNNSGSIGVEDVSSQELKSRIEKYLEGDEDAVPSIFEAILSRKLSGKHDQSDDELMEELQIRTKTSDRDANEEDEFDSGSDS
ncbi:hypothetical protein AB3S75_028093 [Citrus x aurantiifolia]